MEILPRSIGIPYNWSMEDFTLRHFLEHMFETKPYNSGIHIIYENSK